MLVKKWYYYMIDGLKDGHVASLRSTLSMVPDIHDISISPARGLISVKARRDVADEVAMACQIAGTRFRTRVSKSEL